MSRTTKEDFQFRREYKVKRTFTKVRGKWLASIEKSVFVDSKRFFSIYFDMFAERALALVKKSTAIGDTNIGEGILSFGHYSYVEDFIRAM